MLGSCRPVIGLVSDALREPDSSLHSVYRTPYIGARVCKLPFAGCDELRFLPFVGCLQSGARSRGYAVARPSRPSFSARPSRFVAPPAEHAASYGFTEPAILHISPRLATPFCAIWQSVRYGRLGAARARPAAGAAARAFFLPVLLGAATVNALSRYREIYLSVP